MHASLSIKLSPVIKCVIMNRSTRDQIKYRVRHHRQVSKRMQQMKARENSFVFIDEMTDGTDNEHECEFNETPGFSDSLKNWAIEFNISQRAISALLKILIAVGLTFLPADSRSLLKTPRVVQLEECAGGRLWYRGIITNLKSIFKNLTENMSITLNFNFDGTAIFNSSTWNFWPILANINGSLHVLL